MITRTKVHYAGRGRRSGRFVVTGWRERKSNTARFTVKRDSTATTGGKVVTLVEDASWDDSWAILVPVFGRDTEDVLRSALPSYRRERNHLGEFPTSDDNGNLVFEDPVDPTWNDGYDW